MSKKKNSLSGAQANSLESSLIYPRLLAIVPARGGSKRLPRKNARILGGRPLIVWSIDIALKAGIFSDVLLTTDDDELATLGREAGALVPWLRPSELATDTATTSDVLLHALAWYETTHGFVDGVVLLQPTCPLRRNASLYGAVQRFLAQPTDKDWSTVVSVSPVVTPVEWCFHIREKDDRLQPVLGWSQINRRSQDLKQAYRLNGSIYVASSETIRKRRPLVGKGSIAFLMEGAEEAVDIDTEDDWQLAELFINENVCHKSEKN